VTADTAQSTGVGHLSSTTIAWGAVGASAFVLLASGPRLLGVDTYSALAVAWTVVTIFGMGLAIPGEQTVTRAVAGGHLRGVAGAVRARLLVLAALTLALLIPAALGRGTLLGESTVWPAGIVLGAVGWALVAGPRGRLTGAGRFHEYALVLAVEAAVRVVLCAAAWLFRDQAPLLLSLAMGLPLVIAAVTGQWFLRSDAAVPTGQGSALLAEQGAITAVALAAQVVLSTAPLWLAARGVEGAAAAGAFVSATSYMRVPSLFAGGIQAMVLSRSSTAAGIGDTAAVAGLARRSAMLAAAVCTAVVVVLLAVSGPALLLLYGPGIDIDAGVLVVLGASTVIFVSGNVITQVYLGCRRSVSAAVIWVAAAVVTTVALAVLATSSAGAAWAGLIGVAVGVAALVALLPRTVRSVAGAGQPTGGPHHD
jgi:O-antigen/teichoic acid export membrane protein